MILKAYINFNSLPAWLGVIALRQLRDKTGVDIDWEPMLSSLGNVTPPAKTDDPLAEYKARRAKARRAFNESEHMRICDLLGIEADNGRRESDCRAVSVGLLWLKTQAASQDDLFDYITQVFEQHYRDAASIETAEAATALVAQTNVSVEGFDKYMEDEAAALVARQEEMLEGGILSAPAFIVDGELFHGREHMPLITWIVEGRHGTPPV